MGKGKYIIFVVFSLKHNIELHNHEQWLIILRSTFRTY